MVASNTTTPPEALMWHIATALWVMACLSSCSPLDAKPPRVVGAHDGTITAYDVANSDGGPIIAQAIRHGEQVSLLLL